MSTKNNTKYTFGKWHLILHDAFSIRNSFTSNKLLTKAVSFSQASEGPWRACVKATGKRRLDVRVEGNGNAQIPA